MKYGDAILNFQQEVKGTQKFPGQGEQLKTSSTHNHGKSSHISANRNAQNTGYD